MASKLTGSQKAKKQLQEIQALHNEGTPLPHPRDDYFNLMFYRQFRDVEEVEVYRGPYYSWSAENFTRAEFIQFHCADKETANRHYDIQMEHISELRGQFVYSMKLAALFLKRTSKFCVCRGDQNHFDPFICRPMGGMPQRRNRHGMDDPLGFLSECPYLAAVMALARVLIVIVTTLNVTRLFDQICNKVKWRAFELVEEMKQDMRGFDRELERVFLEHFRAGETRYSVVCQEKVSQRVREFEKRLKIKANMIVHMANDKEGCIWKPCVHDEPCPVCKRDTFSSKCFYRCQLILKPVLSLMDH